MALTKVDIATPLEMRGGWAANAAVWSAYGWDDSFYATDNLWSFYDGGGNWACIRFRNKNQAVLFGHDHECSNTYFRESAKYFQEEETNLLEEAPHWWEEELAFPDGQGPWIGFIYGWDGRQWWRANYDIDDGFNQVGLLDSMKVKGTNSISDSVKDFSRPVIESDIQALVDADGAITEEMLEAVMPGYNIKSGVQAANRFLLVELA